MQHWCAVVEHEVLTWPQVTSRPMFGMLACYRDGSIFAALPRTRAAETPFSFLVKLPNEKRLGLRDDGFRRARGPSAGWTTFTMESAADIREALRWLERAYSRTKNEKRRAKNEERNEARKTKERKAQNSEQ